MTLTTWIIIIGGIILIILLIVGVVVSSNSERAIVEKRLNQYLDDDKKDIEQEAQAEQRRITAVGLGTCPPLHRRIDPQDVEGLHQQVQHQHQGEVGHEYAAHVLHPGLTGVRRNGIWPRAACCEPRACWHRLVARSSKPVAHGHASGAFFAPCGSL